MHWGNPDPTGRGGVPLLIRGRFSALDADMAWIRSRHACHSPTNGGALGCSNYVSAVALAPVSAFHFKCGVSQLEVSFLQMLEPPVGQAFACGCINNLCTLCGLCTAEFRLLVLCRSLITAWDLYNENTTCGSLDKEDLPIAPAFHFCCKAQGIVAE